MKYYFTLDGYNLSYKSDNPFDKEIPSDLISRMLDILNRYKDEKTLDDGFYDGEYFGEGGYSEKTGLEDYENFSKTFALEHSERIESLLKGKLKTLEIGCAFGWCVDELRKKGHEAYGCDISEWVINKYPRDYLRTINVQYEWYWNKFDVIYSFATFEHFAKEDVRNVFKYINDNLKPGGLLFATIDDLWGCDKSHQTIMPREWWNRMAKDAGFEVDSRTEPYKSINGYVWRKVNE